MKTLVLLVLLLVLVAGCGPSAVVAPSEARDLVEYSIDKGETWFPLAEAEEEITLLEVSVLWIRGTEAGFGIFVQGDGPLGDIPFQGPIETLDTGTVVVVGQGGVLIKTKTRSCSSCPYHRYAKVVLE